MFSIDPLTAKDLDDAISVKRLANGLLEVGVHIADVSHFVYPGTALDKEARFRATTVYLVQKAIPMLPRLLCEELCSLNPDVDRLSFSVVWIMNTDGDIVEEPWFGKSIIRSRGKLAYEHAQAIIEGKTWKSLPPVTLSVGTTFEDIKKDVLLFYELSRKLRKKRYDAGALSIQSIKLWFALDAVGNPVSTGVYQIKDSNRLIEEVLLSLASLLIDSLCSWPTWPLPKRLVPCLRLHPFYGVILLPIKRVWINSWNWHPKWAIPLTRPLLAPFTLLLKTLKIQWFDTHGDYWQSNS